MKNLEAIKVELIKKVTPQCLGILLLTEQANFFDSPFFTTLNYLSNFSFNKLINNSYQKKFSNNLIVCEHFKTQLPIVIMKQNPHAEFEMKKLVSNFLQLVSGFEKDDSFGINEIKCLLILDTKRSIDLSPLWKVVTDRMTQNGTLFWGKNKRPLHFEIYSTI